MNDKVWVPNNNDKYNFFVASVNEDSLSVSVGDYAGTIGNPSQSAEHELSVDEAIAFAKWILETFTR